MAHEGRTSARPGLRTFPVNSLLAIGYWPLAIGDPALRRWARLCLISLAGCLLYGCARPAPQKVAHINLPEPGSGVFFVATNGNDHWLGRLPEPELHGTNGPFATVSAALEAARLSRPPSGGQPVRAATIYIGPGTYFQDRALALTPRDSGLVLKAYPGAKPVISGGWPIAGWKEVVIEGRKLWAVDLPRARHGAWVFRELWVNGQRATRARYPKHGYLSVAELPDKAQDWTKGHSRFRFREGDLKSGPTITNAEAVVMTRWVESRLPIAGLDEKDRMIRFSKRSVFELAPGDPYYLEGAFEFLTQPGEWYLDPDASRLYYLPRAGESISATRGIAPVLQQVIRMEGHPEIKQFVEHVVLHGLTFSHTEWCFPLDFVVGQEQPVVWPIPNAQVGGFAQAAIGVPAGVWGAGIRNCAFEDCRFSHLGSYGLELGRGCQSNVISRCEFTDLGAGGVKLGETRIRSQAEEQARANEILDCDIHDGGKLFASAVGIWIGQSPDNRIAHNLIHDFYYTGISIGWTWGYGPALASNNVVEFNHVHHLGAKSDGDGPILSDMGGIYTLGKEPGTIIRSNLWHDVAGLRYGGWGIYFDEGSSLILAEDNIVYGTTHGGFHQHYGATNILWNNIFAFARDHQIQRTRPEAHSSFSFVNNIVYFDSGTLLGGNWPDDNVTMDGNVYFDARPNAQPDQLRLGPCSWQKWNERGHDVESLVADPLFVAPGAGDFRLRTNSPALNLGFEPIDLSGVGPRAGSTASP
jgi:hypothetical protein